MEEALLIYLYIALGNVVVGLVAISILYLIIVASVALAWWVEDGIDNIKHLAKITRIKIFGPAVIFVFLLAAAYPDKDDLGFILGGAVAWNTMKYLGDSEEAKKLPDNVLEAMNSFLEQVQREKQ